MNGHHKGIVRALLWLPRVLAAAFAAFLALFALTAFFEGMEFWQTTETFISNLIPSFCVIALLLLGWRRDGLASQGFLVLAVAYFVAFSGWKTLPESLLSIFPPLGISTAYLARMLLLKEVRDAESESLGEGG